MDKEIENPKTGNKIKIKTALQLPDEHPANKKAKDMVAKSPTKDDEPMAATPADKDEPKGPTKNPFSKESPAFEPKQKEIDKELLIKKSDDIVKQFQDGEYESLEDLVMYASPAEIEDSDIFNKIPDVGQNFDTAMEYYYDLNDHKMGVGAPADYTEDQLKQAREGLFKALTTSKEEKGKKKKGFFSKLNPFSKKEVKESKKRRYTVKEVRMWMKKLEENRYKKVYISDARRVAWMVNNEGVELSEMPKSMSKKWTKAQYGRERYLATEFLKSKSEQMNEGKLTEKVKYKKDKKIGGKWYTKQGTHKHQMKANIIAKREFGRYYDTEVVKEKGGYTIYVKPLKEGKLTEAISGADRKILFILVREIVRNLKSKIKNFDVNNKSHLNRVGSSILAIIRAMSYSPDNMNYKNFKKYFPKNFNSKLIQKKLKQFHSQNDKVQITLVTQAIKNELGAGVKEEKLSEAPKPIHHSQAKFTFVPKKDIKKVEKMLMKKFPPKGGYHRIEVAKKTGRVPGHFAITFDKSIFNDALELLMKNNIKTRG